MWTTLLVATTLLGAGDKTVPKGHLVIIGGATIPVEIRQKTLELAGGPQADIAIIASASSIPETSAAETALRFQEIGATSVKVVDPTKADEAAAIVAEAELIWFTGGDQSRLAEVLARTALSDAIRRRYLDGATIAGTSAGAAVMSGLMLTGRIDSDAIRHGSTQLVDGLGLLDEVILDQHFVRRGRFNRLAAAVLDYPKLLGVGIDESTAIVVKGRTFKVSGRSNVILVDARKSSRSEAQQGKPAAVSDLRIHLLTDGMSYDLDKGTVVIAPVPTPVPAAAAVAETRSP